MKLLKKLMSLLMVVSVVVAMGCVSYADSWDDSSGPEMVSNYAGVSDITSHLAKSGKNAKCTLNLTKKVTLSSVHGAFKLMDNSGNVVKTDSRNLIKSDAGYTYSHSFAMPKKGKLHVKYTLKVYKNGKQIDKVTGKTNTVEY